MKTLSDESKITKRYAQERSSLQVSHIYYTRKAMDTPVKTYEISHSWISKRHFTIKHNRQPLLWAHSQYSPFNKPFISLHKESFHGPVLSMAKIDSNTSFRICLGSHQRSDHSGLPVVREKNTDLDEYMFQLRPIVIGVVSYDYPWTRTSNHELRIPKPPAGNEAGPAAEWTGAHDWKLHYRPLRPRREWLGREPARFEDERSQILAVLVHDVSSCLWKKGRIHFLFELPWETEVWVLAALFGLLEMNKRQAERIGKYLT